MKVYIGKYKEWIGPYQIAEKIIFWNEDLAFRFGEWLAEDKHGNETWFAKLCYWINTKKQRTIKVRIDKYDTWSMDDTLAHIILPMLKQLKDTQHGAPNVADKDVPKELRSTDKKKDLFATDENHFKRWEWVLNEMIFAFESKLKDDSDLTLIENGKVNKKNIKLMNDRDKRIANGFRLFGTYYQGLWD